MSTYFLSFIAGGLSLLAPCVLPLLPMIVANTLKSSKLGPLMSALGLAVSFTVFGVLTSAFSSVFDQAYIQKIGALVLIVIGLGAFFPKLNTILFSKLNKVSQKASVAQSSVSFNKSNGALKEFLGGILLGAIWSPCTGPTLAIAFGLASQSKNLASASLTFAMFGLGAGLSMLVFALAVKKLPVLKSTILSNSHKIQKFIGLVSLAIGALILFDLMPLIEEAVLGVMPQWLIDLSVSV